MKTSIPSMISTTKIYRHIVNEKWITTHYLKKSRDNDKRWKNINMVRVHEDYDVLIVGGGVSGLSAGIRLKQLAQKDNKDIKVCLIDKAPEIGAHTMSGSVMETKGLDRLLPNWKELNAPVNEECKLERFYIFTEKHKYPLPLIPGFPIYNKGNYIVRLGHFVKWLGEIAEELGVEIYPGYSGTEVLYDENDYVKGIATNDIGVNKDGSPREIFERGLEIHAKCTIFAEGCRGSLTKEILKKYKLENYHMSYGIGLKEIWELDSSKHYPGYVEHSMGWPLPIDQYGGSFLYHFICNDKPLASVGFVIGLDYKNPYINPYQIFQQYKTHPSIKYQLEGGKRLGYGARALNEGGFQTIPKLVFPGGCIVGCAGSTLNVAKLKGTHPAMITGQYAAEGIYPEIDKSLRIYPKKYEEIFINSDLYKELKSSRNVRPSFNTKYGIIGGLMYTGLFYVILRGKEPWTLSHGKKDNEKLEIKNKYKPINYPKSDENITFDIKSSVKLTNINYEINQPCNIILNDDNIPENINLKLYDCPETKYCPSGVYEYKQKNLNSNDLYLTIKPENCIHCKVCDIKDPTQNIHWVCPEGGNGPKYDGC